MRKRRPKLFRGRHFQDDIIVLSCPAAQGRAREVAGQWVTDVLQEGPYERDQEGSGCETERNRAADQPAPANFSLTNNAGAPASITATVGTPQSATVNTAFATALQATVKDASNNLVSGVTVTFTAPSSGAIAAPQTILHVAEKRKPGRTS